MEPKKITYKYTDTGHWMARCDHSNNVIEFNKDEFFRLSPLQREYIWIHEHVHLLYEVYDEAECNRITDKIFIERAVDSEDRARRVKMVMDSNMTHLESAWVATLITSVISLGTSITHAIISNRRSGYYSLPEADRRSYVDELLRYAYQESLLTDKQSAQDIFWAALSPGIPRRDESTFGTWAANNSFVWDLIDKYSDEYDFSFDAVTPINPQRHPKYIQAQKNLKILGAVAVVVAVSVLLVVLKKNKKL